MNTKTFIIKINKIYFHPKFQDFCGLPYPNHLKGCPNFTRRKNCPYNTPLINKAININLPMYLIGIDFNLKNHRIKMLKRHPKWTMRQANNVIYWQPHHKKQLKELIKKFLDSKTQKESKNLCTIFNPEAYGVNMNLTLRDIGRKLDWHYPLKIVWRIALIGSKIKK